MNLGKSIAAAPATLGPATGLAALCLLVLVVAAPGTAAAGPPQNDKYSVSCLACHGADLEGVDELGPALAKSAFVASKSVAELVAFLKVGRMPDDPDSVTGRPMPGFGWVPEAELEEIAAYVKSHNAH